MRNTIYFVLSALIISFSFFGCESNNENDPNFLLDQVGFVGSLPDGRTFGNTGIKFSHGLSFSSFGNSNGGSSFVYHGFTIRDEISGIDISVRIPGVKYSDRYESDVLDAKKIAQEYYPYEVVKENLSLGNKNIPFQPDDTDENTFFVTVLDQVNYNGYVIAPLGYLEEGNFLKVIKLTEGVETIQGDEVRTIEVLFELDIRMFATELELNPQFGNLKGQLMIKYVEDLSKNSF